MDIVTVGDNCIDDYSYERKSFPGGNAVNVAVYLKRYEVNTSYIGVVGSDGNGKRMIESINNQGVDVSHVLIKEGKTAVTTVVLNGGERKFTGYDEGVLRDFILSKENIQYVKKHKIVHSAISGHCEDYFKEFQKSGLITSFDFSNEVESPLINKLASYVDYPFLSYSEDDAFIRELLIEIKNRGSKVPIATLGENGSLAYDGSNFYEIKTKDVNVKDTMGAGDSFIAGFLYGIFKNYPTEECLKIATDNAAKTITYHGAW